MNKSFAPLIAFLQGSFPFSTHAGLAITWMIGLYGSLFAMNHQTWKLDDGFWGGLASLFLMLFFLRGLDEIKDLPYDTLYNPDRPLVTGIVTIKHLVFFLIVSGLLLIGINMLISGISTGMVVFIIGYSLFLLLLEKYWSGFSDHLLLNAFFSHVLHISKNIYIFLLYYRIYPVIGMKEVFFILSYSLGFFHFEFLRKAVWPEDLKANERSYTHYFGAWRMLGLALLFSWAATIIQVTVFRTGQYPTIPRIQQAAAWLPVIALMIGGWNIVYFIKNRRKKYYMKPKAAMYYGAFHQMNAIYGMTASTIIAVFF